MTVSDRPNRPASAVVELRTTLSHLDGGRARSGSTQDIDVPSVLCVVSASSRLHLAFIPNGSLLRGDVGREEFGDRARDLLGRFHHHGMPRALDDAEAPALSGREDTRNTSEASCDPARPQTRRVVAEISPMRAAMPMPRHDPPHHGRDRAAQLEIRAHELPSIAIPHPRWYLDGRGVESAAPRRKGGP